MFVEIFQYRTNNELEGSLNNWIDQKQANLKYFEIIDIKFSATTVVIEGESVHKLFALIMYKL